MPAGFNFTPGADHDGSDLPCTASSAYCDYPDGGIQCIRGQPASSWTVAGQAALCLATPSCIAFNSDALGSCLKGVAAPLAPSGEPVACGGFYTLLQGFAPPAPPPPPSPPPLPPSLNLGVMYTPALKAGLCLDNCDTFTTNTSCTMINCPAVGRPTWVQLKATAQPYACQLQNVHTGLCLGFPAAGGGLTKAVFSPHFPAQSIPCSGAYTTWVAPPLAGSTGTTFRLKYGPFNATGNVALPDMCLDVAGGQTTAGGAVIVYPCHVPEKLTQNNQIWLFAS